MYPIKNNKRNRKERTCHLCTNDQKIKNNILVHINNENIERPKTPTTPELINIVLELEQLKNKFNEKAINTVDLKIETTTTEFKKLNL